MKPPTTALAKIEQTRNLLAFLLVGTFLGTVPILMLKAIPPANEAIVTYMIGQLSGMALTALGFYFVNKVGQDALDATKADNTGKAFAAVEAAAKAGTGKSEDIPEGTKEDPLIIAGAPADAPPVHIKDTKK